MLVFELFSYGVQTGRAIGGIAGSDGLDCSHDLKLANKKSSIAAMNAVPQFESLQAVSSQLPGIPAVSTSAWFKGVHTELH